mmetsp:Transcript_28071/g.91024  ORF Transcript_28071/g.91024 Transcript_28071/m.91024 type:complete len:273 (+) Transcript_28071:216-1034(+)
MTSGLIPHVLAASLGALEHLPSSDAVALVVELPVVKLLELDLVRDREDPQIHLSAAIVDLLLDIWRYSVGAFVEDDEGGPMVEQPCESNLLLLPRAQIFLPVPRVIQFRADDLPFLEKLKIGSAILVENFRAAVSPSQTLQNLFVRPPLLLHGLPGVWVGNEVPQSSNRNEVDLSEEVNLLLCRHRDGSADQGPQLADHAKERRLAAAVASCHEHAHASLYFEVQILHEQRPIWPEHGHVLELEILPVLERRWEGSLLGGLDLLLQDWISRL